MLGAAASSSARWSMAWRSSCCSGGRWLMSLLREVTVAADTKAPPDLEQPDPTDDSAALPDNEPPPKV